MSLIVVGSMAFDAIETPFGKSDKIVGGAATYIAWSASNFTRPDTTDIRCGWRFSQRRIENVGSTWCNDGRRTDQRK